MPLKSKMQPQDFTISLPNHQILHAGPLRLWLLLVSSPTKATCFCPAFTDCWSNLEINIFRPFIFKLEQNGIKQKKSGLQYFGLDKHFCEVASHLEGETLSCGGLGPFGAAPLGGKTLTQLGVERERTKSKEWLQNLQTLQRFYRSTTNWSQRTNSICSKLNWI